jgi:hypothetical protein
MLRHFYKMARTQIGTHEVDEFLRANLIDPDDVGPQERSYLAVLRECGRASLETLALQLETDRSEVQYQIEPPLVRLRPGTSPARGAC